MRNSSVLARRAVLLVILTMSTGCFLSPSDEKEDDSRSGFHDVTVNWQIKNVDGSLMSSCPPGYTTIAANLYRGVDVLVPPPDAWLTMPCTPEGSFTQPVATAGELKNPDDLGYFDYTPQKDIVLWVTEETLSAFAASTSVFYVDALTSDLSIDFDLYPEGGVGVVAWQFTSSLTTAPLTSCETAGVDEIEAAVRPYSDEAAPLVVAGAWACDEIDPYQYYEPNGNGFALIDEEYELGSGTTSGLAVGEYFAELRAKREGAVVGVVEGQLVIEGMNDANPIWPASIPINDR